jgi:NitT/TauT family transport system ATP-binding protein
MTPTATSQPPFITLEGVTKRWSNGATVLDGITLRADRGEFISLIGPSGCGKSTLLRLLAGLSPVSSGSVKLDGMQPESAREIMSFIFQDATLLPWRTVRSNVELGLELEGKTTESQRRATSTALLQLVGLSDVADLHPRQLSGGMRMRVSIARALATQPKILLMDEPFGALDALTREEMSLELLRLWSTRQMAVIFVTHSIPEAILLADRVVVMSPRPGRIADIIPVGLPRPRAFEQEGTEEFQRCAARIRALIFRGRDANAA